MSTFFPPVTIEQPKSGRGGGGLHPPAYGGGGDNRPGDGAPDYDRRLRRRRLALLCGLASISILFVTVTVISLALRHGALVLDPKTSRYVRQWAEVNLPVQLLLLNTFVLLLSSLTIEMARRKVACEMVLAPIRSLPGIALEGERRIPWLSITVILGMLFLAGQWLAWEAFRSRGYQVTSLSPSQFFYVLTGAHAVHLSVGILVLLYAAIISFLRRGMAQRRIIVEVAAWYWHFMGALWLYVFALLELGT